MISDKSSKEISKLKVEILELKREFESWESEIQKLRYDNGILNTWACEFKALENERDKLSISLKDAEETWQKYYQIMTEYGTVKMKYKKLSQMLIDKEVEIKTHLRDKERLMNEVVDLKVQLASTSDAITRMDDKLKEIN